MGKAATKAPAGMERGELRKMLKFAAKEPVRIAFALGGDGKAILKMDKRQQPRALEKALKDDSPDSKNHRFGHVIVDPEQPKLARFVVNKASGGMARKLIIALKGTGYSQVELVLEDGSPVESAQSEEEEDADTDTGADADGDEEDEADSERRVTAPDDDATVSRYQPPDDDGGVPPASGTGNKDYDETPAYQAEGGEAPQDEQPDPAELTRTLTGLVKRMIGAIAQDPSKKTALAELATDAQASLKRGDLAQAAAGIEILREALDPMPDAGGPAANGQGQNAQGQNAQGQNAPGQNGQGQNGSATSASAQKLAKSRMAWIATRARIDAELRKLNAEIVSLNDSGDFGDDLGTSFTSVVEPLLMQLDESLSDVLGEAAQATDPAESARLMQQARATIDRYNKFIAGSPIIQDLDNNPFVPLAIGKTLTATLSTLAAMMR